MVYRCCTYKPPKQQTMDLASNSLGFTFTLIGFAVPALPGASVRTTP